MTLFTLLLVLGWERLFKFGEHWQLEHRIRPVFRGQTHFSMIRTTGMAILAMLITLVLVLSLRGVFFGVPSLLLWVVVGVLCIGAGVTRLHYHAYLKSASVDDQAAHQAMAEELSQIHGLPDTANERVYLRELQNALLWINYRFYLAPLFWFVVGGPWGPVTLVGYAFLRAWQGWLAAHQTAAEREQSGVEKLLFVLDWIPVRLAGVAYALLGHGEKALPAWWKFLRDVRHTPYQVLTRLAQFSLERDPCTDKVEKPRMAVALAKRITLVLVVVVALLTITGTLL
ncbi:beta-lactamase regulator AmpE [Tatumella sp. JGM118]|uniref:Beta-lactamase regulator AmpE n=1 Tax=Tatumella terrea TaxID=419007 RepID=A0ABW1W2Z6_9GAMM|nr:beta-lactamase regulator AmpE [Tatumella sp. JGM118]MBS0908798.1 beta-lactamase regulator AmpE [Tatumella sp. JGM118]